MAESRIRRESDNCPVCGGTLIGGRYDHVLGGYHLEHQKTGETRWLQHIILDVPALICTTCGSPWVREGDRILERVQAYVKESADMDVFVSTIRYTALLGIK